MNEICLVYKVSYGESVTYINNIAILYSSTCLRHTLGCQAKMLGCDGSIEFDAYNSTAIQTAAL